MATVCPWQATTVPTPSPTQQPGSPTLQEIMDEELARRLQDEEDMQLIHAADWQLVDPDESTSEEEQVDEEFEDKEPVPEEKQVDNDDDEEDALDVGDDEEYEYAGKGLNSFHESMRRQGKLDSRRAPFRTSLGKNGGAVRKSLFDERTQAILHKLVKKETVTEVRNRVHTGREANVYHGTGLDSVSGRERALALKVFKTSKGDYSKFNECDESGRKYDLHFAKKRIRRQLKIGTEREYKYISRASAALAPATVTETDEKLVSAGRGARVPKPLALRDHVLITEFVGNDGHPAAPLQDAFLTSVQLCSAYTDLLRAVRRLYHRARLVHGQLSPSNILFHDGQCWIMDLGHAVEVNSENDKVLLTSDLDSLDAFFRSRGVPAVMKRCVGLLDVETAKEYVVTESPEALLRRFPTLEPLLRD